jgi:polyhydroxybutyrate depolymerase
VGSSRFLVVGLLGTVAALGSACSTASDPSAGATDDALTSSSGSCGTRAGHRGATSRSLVVAGLHRTYRVYLPAAADPSKALPLVFVHHGFTMSGKAMESVTKYAELADREGIVLVFPDGQGGPDSTDAPWNVGAHVCPSTLGDVPVATGDDFAFLDAIRADLAQDQCVDSAHVYLTGFSMGGYFAHHAGCMRPDLRAVAPHSGGTHDLASCPVARKPIIIFHGDADQLIPDGCDDPRANDTPAGFTPSAKAWAEHNGCGTTMHTVPTLRGTCSYYDGCPADGQVAICVLQGMDHCWAGGGDDGAGNGCEGWASATSLEWEFFKQYAW